MRLQTPQGDEGLVRRLGAGEADAFDELYRRYAGRLAAYGARLLGDRAAGEDVAQAALFKAYRALQRGARPTHVKAWLFRIAHNVALDQLARRRDVLALDSAEPTAPDRDHGTAGELVRALRSLPERQLRVFLLREVRGLRCAEVAAELGLGESQVEQALFAARNRLAEHLTFGARLDCATLQGLDDASLGRAGSRAVRAHLRACPACRASRPLKTRIAVGLALPGDLLRGWLAALLSGGAPAKVVAVAAAGAVAASTPVVAPKVVALARPKPPRAAPAVVAPLPERPVLVAWHEQPAPAEALVALAAPKPEPPASTPIAPAPVPAEQPPVEEAPPQEEPVAQEEPAPVDEAVYEEPLPEEEPVYVEEPVYEEPPPEAPLPEEAPPPAEEAPPVEEPAPEAPPAEEPAP